MSLIRTLLLFAAVTGCAATPPRESAKCDASGADRLIGQAAAPELAERARRMAHARSVRWLRPGQIVTQEYRADRLNLALDAQDRIEAIRCG